MGVRKYDRNVKSIEYEELILLSRGFHYMYAIFGNMETKQYSSSIQLISVNNDYNQKTMNINKILFFVCPLYNRIQ